MDRHNNEELITLIVEGSGGADGPSPRAAFVVNIFWRTSWRVAIVGESDWSATELPVAAEPAAGIAGLAGRAGGRTEGIAGLAGGLGLLGGAVKPAETARPAAEVESY